MTMGHSRWAKIFGGLAASLPLAGCSPVPQLQSAAAAGGALINSVSATGEQTTLSPGELRLLQSRDYPATKPAAFASVMTVLLDSGYRVLSADLETGLITAAASTAGRLRLDPTGVSRANQTPLASAYIEERGAAGSRVRMSFSTGVSETGRLGSTGERAVLDADLYRTFFDQLQLEMAERAEMPTPPPEPQASKAPGAPPEPATQTPPTARIAPSAIEEEPAAENADQGSSGDDERAGDGR